MGSLAFAGVLSGAGQGMGKGLEQLQQGGMLAYLQKERDAMEQKRLELTFGQQDRMQARQFEHATDLASLQMGHAERLEDRREAHAAGLQETALEAQRGMNQERIGASIVEKGMEVNQRREEKAQDKSLKERELASLDKEHTARAGYYDAYRQYLLGGKTSGSGASSPAKLDLETRKAGAAFYNSRIMPLEKQLLDPMTPESEREAISERIEKLSKEGLGILGFTPGRDEAPTIVDPRHAQSQSSMEQQDPTLADSQADAGRELDNLRTGKSGVLNSVTPPSAPNLPIMGNPKKITPEVTKRFLAQTRAAQAAGKSLGDITDAFIAEYGRTPNQADYDALTRAERGR